MLLPFALAQFIASYDGSSMNVAISDVAADLDSTVTDIQTAITLYTLVIAACMLIGGRLSDIWGRRVCFQGGVALYGLGALITALSPAFWVMITGWSILEGIASGLMIPPIYILISVSFDNLKDRARAFGLVSAMSAVALAAGPLLGGFFATYITWRASFATEVLVTILILYLSLRIVDVPARGPKPSLDVGGAVLSAAGLIAIVLGILQSRYYGWFSARKDFKIGDTVIVESGQVSPIWLIIGLDSYSSFCSPFTNFGGNARASTQSYPCGSS
jgi:MFS family permease